MIDVSLEEATILLNDWKERRVLIGASVVLREDAKEEHKFWARVAEVSGDKISLAGDHALVEVPFEEGVILQYSEVSEAPARLREFFCMYEFCFVIRSKSVFALLFGAGPKKE